MERRTVYRRADGELVYGEYSFVTDTAFFDDVDEPLDVIKEVWVIESSELITFKPYGWDEAQEEDGDGE